MRTTDYGPYQVSRCPCGHPSCNDWHVSPVAALQGVKFTEGQAHAVARFLQAYDTAPGPNVVDARPIREILMDEIVSWRARSAYYPLPPYVEVPIAAGVVVRAYDEIEKLCAIAGAPDDAVRNLKSRLDARLNDVLAEMRPGYDDSIVGFNEAWDVMRKLFAEAAS